MKRAFLFSFLILCISCFSCDKAKDSKKEYKRSIVGDWDWVNSTSGNNGETSYPLITHSPSSTDENYGLRIKRNSNAYLYRNGEQIKKGKLEGIEDTSSLEYDGGKTSTNYFYKLTFNFNDEKVIFISKSPTGLTSATWPYSNQSNNFKKKLDGIIEINFMYFVGIAL